MDDESSTSREEKDSKKAEVSSEGTDDEGNQVESSSNAEGSLDGAKNCDASSEKIVAESLDGAKSLDCSSKKTTGGKGEGRKDLKKHVSSLSNGGKPSNTAHDAKSRASSRKTIIKEDGGNASKRKATSKPMDDSRKKRHEGASRPGRIL